MIESNIKNSPKKPCRRPILVTGSHRSGSTWVGSTIAKSSEIAYIGEPFNIKANPGIIYPQFDKWFTIIDQTNDSKYKLAIENTLKFKYQYTPALKSIKNTKEFGKILLHALQFEKAKLLNQRPLMKDPIALLSADWLARNFNMNVIVLIRHPAAFVGSLKKAEWHFPFKDLNDQANILKTPIKNYREQIESYTLTKRSLIDQGILLWNIFHETIKFYMSIFPNWIYIKHEDISSDPVKYFSIIFDHVELDFTQRIKKHIDITTNSKNPTEHKKVSDIKRNSKKNIHNWKNRLTKKEIYRIRAKTEQISNTFYSSDEWE